MKIPDLNRIKCGPVMEFKTKKLKCMACGFTIPDEPNKRDYHFFYYTDELHYYHLNNKNEKY